MSYGAHTSSPNTADDFRRQYGSQLRLLQRRSDLSAWAGSIGRWDFTTGYGAPGGPDTATVGDVPAGAKMRNLIPGGPDAVRDTNYPNVSYALPSAQSAGGVSFTGDASIKLADLPTFTGKPFVGISAIGWLQPTGAPTTDTGTRILKLGPFYLVPYAGDLEIHGPNLFVGSLPADLRNALSSAQDKPLQLALNARNRGAGKYRAEILLNRNPLFMSDDTPAGNGQGADGKPLTYEAAIGARDGRGTVPGPWQAIGIDDYSVPGRSFEEVLQADFRLRGRAFGLYDY